MATAKKGNTIADLRAVHDRSVVIPNRIRAALAALLATGDTYAYESDFIKAAKPPISAIDISRFREEFKDFWSETPASNGKSSARKVWFSTKKACDEWKEVIGEK